jgi:hypothetical protein
VTDAHWKPPLQDVQLRASALALGLGLGLAWACELEPRVHAVSARVAMTRIAAALPSTSPSLVDDPWNPAQVKFGRIPGAQDSRLLTVFHG